MLVELSLNAQEVEEHNKITRENQEACPNLNFQEVGNLEAVFLPYSKMLETNYLDGCIKIQEDYRDNAEFCGIYMCDYDSNHLLKQITNYKEVVNMESPIYNLAYGVADNASQVLDYFERLCKEHREYTNGKNFVILMTPVFREEEPKEDDWRWEKWGDYIGNFEPKHEYLWDEEGIDFVWVFHIVEVEKQEG